MCGNYLSWVYDQQVKPKGVPRSVKILIEPQRRCVVSMTRIPACLNNPVWTICFGVGEDLMVNAVLVRNEERINRLLNGERVRGWCGIVLVMYLALVAVSFATAVRNQGQTVFGTTLGADFPAFYVAGKIINEHGAAQLYNRELQGRLYHELFPREDPDALLPYLNAPFFALPFPLLAHLPYAWAYLCWFLITLGLYVAGFTLLWRELEGLPALAYRTALIIALSFMPFLVECVAGGQTSAVGFFALALAVVLERHGQWFWSGAVLALLLYKPTLLVLLGPMVLLTRRWKTLAGMAAGGAGLLALSVLTLSLDVTLGWFQTMLGYAQLSTSGTSGAASGLRIWKYVDVNAFARAFWASNAALRWLTVGIAVAFFLPMLVKAWWPRGERSRENREADWALAVAWTPVLNLYVGVYDVTLIVVSAVLLAAWQLRQGRLLVQAKVLLLLLYVTPWLAQPVARATGLQLLTVVLAAFGLYVLRWRQAEQEAGALLRVGIKPEAEPA